LLFIVSPELNSISLILDLDKLRSGLYLSDHNAVPACHLPAGIFAGKVSRFQLTRGDIFSQWDERPQTLPNPDAVSALRPS
jgi:hypothetical protein